MNVLITGDLGFIGAHMRKAFEVRGDTVWGLDRGRGAVQDLRFCQWGAAPDLIVHLAAFADIRYNWAEGNLEGVWGHNVDTTLRLLMAHPGVPIMFASTCAVYGPTASHGAQEDTAPNVQSPYAASKLAGESLITAFAAKYATPHHIFRLPCVVGPGYAHGHIADFAEGAMWGQRIEAASFGYARRTHIHVSDVCSVFTMAASGQIGTGVYNVGAGAWSCRDTARLMGLEDGEDILWPTRAYGWPGDHHVIASAGKLNAQGWRAMGSIEQGVREALESNGWRGAK